MPLPERWGKATPRVQQPERTGRVGVLHFSEHDPESATYIAAFLKRLGELHWTVGNNLQVDYRWTGGLEGRMHQYAEDLVALAPDVVLAAGDPHVGSLQQVTRSVPIVFVQVADALGGGFVTSLARPGGNATGVTNLKIDLGANRLELLKTIAHIWRGWPSCGTQTSGRHQTGRCCWYWRDP